MKKLSALILTLVCVLGTSVIAQASNTILVTEVTGPEKIQTTLDRMSRAGGAVDSILTSYIASGYLVKKIEFKLGLAEGCTAIIYFESSVGQKIEHINYYSPMYTSYGWLEEHCNTSNSQNQPILKSNVKPKLNSYDARLAADPRGIVYDVDAAEITQPWPQEKFVYGENPDGIPLRITPMLAGYGYVVGALPRLETHFYPHNNVKQPTFVNNRRFQGTFGGLKVEVSQDDAKIVFPDGKIQFLPSNVKAFYMNKDRSILFLYHLDPNSPYSTVTGAAFVFKNGKVKEIPLGKNRDLDRAVDENYKRFLGLSDIDHRESGRIIKANLKPHPNYAPPIVGNVLEFDPAGDYVIANGESTRMLNLKTGKLVRIMHIHENSSIRFGKKNSENYRSIISVLKTRSHDGWTVAGASSLLEGVHFNHGRLKVSMGSFKLMSREELNVAEVGHSVITNDADFNGYERSYPKFSLMVQGAYEKFSQTKNF